MKFLSKIDNNKTRFEEYSITIQIQNLTQAIIDEVCKTKLCCINLILNKDETIYFEDAKQFKDSIVIENEDIYFKSIN